MISVSAKYHPLQLSQEWSIVSSLPAPPTLPLLKFVSQGLVFPKPPLSII